MVIFDWSSAYYPIIWLEETVNIFVIQILLSAILVMAWQLMFGWLMFKKKDEDIISEKIDEIGKK
jgi:hypothetical protein